MMDVLVRPPSESCSSRVNLLSLFQPEEKKKKKKMEITRNPDNIKFRFEPH